MSQITLKTSASAEQTGIWRHHPAGHRPVWRPPWTFIGAAFSRRRVVTIWGALLGAILVNALSNGLGLLGVNIFWMGAIKGGLILVVLAASAVRHKGGEA